MDEEIREPQTVDSQTSLCSYLHDLRIDRGIEQEKLSNILGIPQRLIETVEAGDRNKLPGDAYMLGIAKKYSVYFRIPYEELEAMWQREQIHIVSGESDVLPQNRFITPRRRAVSLRLSGAIIFFLFTFAYLGIQFIMAIAPIRVTFNDLPTVTNQSTIEVSGSFTGKPKSAYLNNQSIRIDNNGFKTEVFLVPGPNRIRIVTENYMGASTTIERIVVYQE